MFCKQGREFEILRTPFGYYIGTIDEEEGPWCRATNYFYTRKEAEEVLKTPSLLCEYLRDCPENKKCANGTCLEMVG